MKLNIIHGDDLAKLQLKLESVKAEAKKVGRQIRILSAGEVNIAEELAKTDLFADEPLYIIASFAKIAPRELKFIVKNKEKVSGSLVGYNEGLLGKSILNLLPREVKVEQYKLPRVIFKFLDSFYPGNGGVAVRILSTLSKKEPPEYILAILGRHLRDLYWARVNASSLPYKEDWRILKLLNQAKKFKKGQLQTIIADVAGLDVAIKTSSDSFEGQLDQLIFTQLE
jgi:DNA polymerase III delta subunit